MKRSDLVGKTFGRLKVENYDHSVKTKNGGYAMWKCSCTCGCSAIVRTSHLVEGRVRSCGCYLIESLSEHPRASKPEGAAYLRYVFGYYIKNAKIRSLSFNLSFDEFCQIVVKNCYYCGLEPEQGRNKSRLNRPKVFNGITKHNGIDRVDNSRGYVQDNIVPCCKTCQYAKRAMTEIEFYTWVRRVHAFTRGR